MMLAKVLGISQLDVAHIVLALPVLDKSPSVTIQFTLPDIIGDVAFQLDVGLRVGAESREEEAVYDGPGGFSVSHEGTHIITVVNLELTQWVVNLIGKHILVPLSGIRILIIGIGGIVGSSRVEHLLHIILPLAVVLRAHNAKFKLQLLVERQLLRIDFDCIVAHIGVAECALLLHES